MKKRRMFLALLLSLGSLALAACGQGDTPPAGDDPIEPGPGTDDPDTPDDPVEPTPSMTDEEVCQEVINSSAILTKNDRSPIRDTSWGVQNTLSSMSGNYLIAQTSYSYLSEDNFNYDLTIEWSYSTSEWLAETVEDGESSYLRLTPVYGSFGETTTSSITGTAKLNSASASLTYTLTMNSDKEITAIKDMPTSGAVVVQGYITGFIPDSTDSNWYGVTVQSGDYGFMIHKVAKSLMEGYEVGDCIEVSGTSSPYNNTRQITGSTAVVTRLTGAQATQVASPNIVELEDVNNITTDTYGALVTVSGAKVVEAEDITNYYQGSATEHGYVQAKVLYRGYELYLYSDRYNVDYPAKAEWYEMLKDALDNNETKTITFTGMKSQGKWAYVTGEGDAASTNYNNVNPALMFVNLSDCQVVDEPYQEVEVLNVTYTGNGFVDETGRLVVEETENSGSEFTYESSDEAIATVDEEGNVTVVGEGEVTITVTSVANPSIKGTIVINCFEQVGQPDYQKKTVSEVLEVENTKTVAYVVRGKVKGLGNNGDEEVMNQFGSMHLEDLDDPSKSIVVYGLSPDYSALTYDAESGEYSYSGHRNANTHDNTKDIKIGDTITMVAIRNDHRGTPQLNGVLSSVNDEMVPVATQGTLKEVMEYTPGYSGSDRYLNSQRVYEITVTISGWREGNSDGTQYGNFYVTDGEGNECLVYGATAQSNRISFNYQNRWAYSLNNPRDWLTNEVTSGLTIGDTITMTVVRCDYNGAVQICGENVRLATEVTV